MPLASGVPGTPSNLPRPTSRPATGSSSYSRSTENISYQTSRVVKRTKLPQGGVKRLSLSVLVDHTLRWEGTRRVVEAPAAEKLKVIKDLVTAAVGLDAARGDQLVVEAFPFDATLTAEPPAQPQALPVAPPAAAGPAWMQKLKGGNGYVLMGVGGAAVIALAAGFVILRRRSRVKKIRAEAVAALAAAKAKTPMTPEELERQIEGKLAEREAEGERLATEAMMALQTPVAKTKKAEVLSKHIAAEGKKDPTLQAQVVRSWLHG